MKLPSLSAVFRYVQRAAEKLPRMTPANISMSSSLGIILQFAKCMSNFHAMRSKESIIQTGSLVTTDYIAHNSLRQAPEPTFPFPWIE